VYLLLSEEVVARASDIAHGKALASRYPL